MSIPFHGEVSNEFLQILRNRHELEYLATIQSVVDDCRKWIWAYKSDVRRIEHWPATHQCSTPMDLQEAVPILAAAIELSR